LLILYTVDMTCELTEEDKKEFDELVPSIQEYVEALRVLGLLDKPYSKDSQKH